MAILSENLVLVNVLIERKEEVLEKLARLLEREGYVKNTYLDAVIEREKVFPTGLPTDPLGIAIPHSDAEHCLQPAIAVATLQSPVTFGLMGDDHNTVAVQVVFMLALDKAEKQAEFIGKFAELFRNGQALQDIVGSTCPAQVIACITKCIDL